MAEQSPFDTLESSFHLLCAGPSPLAVHGRELGRPFPARSIPLDELRGMLLHPSTPYAARDRAVRLLLERSAERGGAWTVGLAGVVLPGLRRGLASLARAWPSRRDDLEADALAGLVEAIAAFDPTVEPVAARLVWRVTSHARRRHAREMAIAGRHVQSPGSAEPHRPWGHPDFVLAAAEQAGIVSAEDAELIGETRLGNVAVHDFAARRGESKTRCWCVAGGPSGASSRGCGRKVCKGTPVGAAVYGCGTLPGRRGHRARSVLARTTEPTKGGLPLARLAGRERPDHRPQSNPGGAPTLMRTSMTRLAVSVTVALAALAVAATSAAAAGASPSPPPPGLGQVVDNTRLWVMGLLAAVATLFFVIGGARYVLAGGDPSQVERAKQTLKSALAGYALAVLAPVALSILRGIVGG